MVRSQKQNLRAAIAIIFMLAASPLTVTYVNADTAEKESIPSKSEKQAQFEHQKTILTENIVNGKLKVSQFDVPKDASNDEIRQILEFNGEIHKWTFVKGNSYNSGIVLYDGTAIKVDERKWLINTKGTLEVDENSFDLELQGQAKGDKINLHGTATKNELKYKIVLSGNVSIAGDDGLTIAFYYAGLKNLENGTEINLYQFGKVTVESESGLKLQNDSFKRSFLVV